MEMSQTQVASRREIIGMVPGAPAKARVVVGFIGEAIRYARWAITYDYPLSDETRTRERAEIAKHALLGTGAECPPELQEIIDHNGTLKVSR